jgi:hypothetical protein
LAQEQPLVEVACLKYKIKNYFVKNIKKKLTVSSWVVSVESGGKSNPRHRCCTQLMEPLEQRQQPARGIQPEKSC